jgi:hypothetical protein
MEENKKSTQFDDVRFCLYIRVFIEEKHQQQ